jgi:hypothetical protein
MCDRTTVRRKKKKKNNIQITCGIRCSASSQWGKIRMFQSQHGGNDGGDEVIDWEAMGGEEIGSRERKTDPLL